MCASVWSKLIAWFDTNGRTFIWRERREPFVVLIAEILLKKTSANVVNQFLPRFLDRYSDMHALNDSTFEELEEALAPLGLSAQRGEQLKSLAQALVQSYDGVIPNERDKLLQLPGIGEYTVGAVLSFAYGKPEAMVDTNVARIIIRFYGIKPSRYEARRSPEVWEKAWQLASQDSKCSHKINWALLDLGALICKSRKPKCDECPLNSDCAFATSQNAHT
jgi:A/G-specific adenine glycosylase